MMQVNANAGLGSPMVSVVMNCYNGARFLREAVDSILSQTYPHWEVVFWDNQSTDESASLFKAYSDPRLKYFRAERHTLLGEARVEAVGTASGDWLAFLDCDDVWLPRRLESHMEIVAHESSDLGLLYCRAQVLVGDDERRGDHSHFPLSRLVGGSLLPSRNHFPELPQGNILRNLAMGNFITLATATVRRSTFLSTGGFSGRYNQAEDYEMFLNVARVSRAMAVDEPLALYRTHATNLSHRQKELAVREGISLIESLPSGKTRSEGLRAAHTDRALHLMRSGEWISGLVALLKAGSVPNFLGRLLLRSKSWLLSGAAR